MTAWYNPDSLPSSSIYILLVCSSTIAFGVWEIEGICVSVCDQELLIMVFVNGEPHFGVEIFIWPKDKMNTPSIFEALDQWMLGDRSDYGSKTHSDTHW